MKKKINKHKLKEQLKLGGIAFGLAIIVWMVAKAGETRESQLIVPVQVTSVGDQVEVQVIPEHISVVVRYGRAASSYISSENFRFVVDGSNMQENMGVSWKTVTLGLSDEHFVANIPSARVDLAKIGSHGNTVEIKMRYDAVPAIVTPEIVGLDRLPEGYQLSQPVKVIPRDVYLIGDEDKLRALPRDEMTSRVMLKTAPVSVAGRTESALESVEIQLPVGVDMVQRKSAIAEVNLEIHEVQTLREISNIPLSFQALAPDTVEMQYDVKAASVTVFGPQSLLTQLTPESFRVSLVRPPEEVPGPPREVPLEIHFASSVPDEIRNRVTIRSIKPAVLQVRYLSIDKTAPADAETTSTEGV